MKKERPYYSWKSMVQRCHDKNRKDYPRYGGKGIKVCRHWRKYANFLEDMGVPKPDEVLDRIDSTKGYFKANCRWVTITENNRNRSICVACKKLNLAGEVLAEYDNISIAVEEGEKLIDTHISACILGKRKTHGGFKWARA